MNQITPPPKIEIIPSSAPFSEAQRSWLYGFFAGLLSDAPTPLSAEQGAAVMEGGDVDDGAPPWHDQTIPISDRMKLAEGRPLRRNRWRRWRSRIPASAAIIATTFRTPSRSKPRRGSISAFPAARKPPEC